MYSRLFVRINFTRIYFIDYFYFKFLGETWHGSAHFFELITRSSPLETWNNVRNCQQTVTSCHLERVLCTTNRHGFCFYRNLHTTRIARANDTGHHCLMWINIYNAAQSPCGHCTEKIVIRHVLSICCGERIQAISSNSCDWYWYLANDCG